METVLSVVICAILFAVFGVVRRDRCDSACAGCTVSCGRLKRLDHHD
jgi:hypothetical protein